MRAVAAGRAQPRRSARGHRRGARGGSGPVLPGAEIPSAGISLVPDPVPALVPVRGLRGLGALAAGLAARPCSAGGLLPASRRAGRRLPPGLQSGPGVVETPALPVYVLSFFSVFSHVWQATRTIRGWAALSAWIDAIICLMAGSTSEAFSQCCHAIPF